MASLSPKNSGYASDLEVDSNQDDLHLRSKVRALRLLETARTATTTLALLMGLAVLGLSADGLAVHARTQAAAGSPSLLPLWPDDFNLGPTEALEVGSFVIVVANAASLVFSKVQRLRAISDMHTISMIAAPFASLAGAVLGVAFFYAVNASSTTDTLLSWSCRWRSLSMTQQPYWGNLCSESWAAVGLAVALVPLQLCVAGIACYQFSVERHTRAYARARKGSPVA